MHKINGKKLCALLFGLSLLAGCGGGGGGGGSSTGDIKSGQIVSGSVSADAWKHYAIEVPEGAEYLDAYLELASGAIEVMLKHGKPMTHEMYENDEEDCYDWAEHPDYETAYCSVNNPAPGKWYISILGWDRS